VLPFVAGARVTTGDFFEMFNVPFLYGGGWEASADQSAEQVVVLSKQLNQRLYGGENSVGNWLTMEGRRFQVVGVTDAWEPMPRYFDPINGPVQEVNEMFIPYSLTRPMQLYSAGSDWGWKDEDIESFEQWLNSESVWVQYWVELESPGDRADFFAHLDAYVSEQKKLGRFERPMNNNLYDVEEWLDYHEVVARDSKVLLGLSFLFLVVCLLSTIALLLTKFAGKKGETSLRRALGASRRAIFGQQIVEVAVIGFSGGLIGLGLALLGLQGIDVLYDAPDSLVRIEWVMVLAAIALAIVSATAAGLYPAWRICRIQPASQLKTL
jgi:putative ABC transport system permease protein